jgi:hypothetical protein
MFAIGVGVVLLVALVLLVAGIKMVLADREEPQEIWGKSTQRGWVQYRGPMAFRNGKRG